MRYFLSVILLSFSFVLNGVAATSGKQEAAFYIEAYGEIAPSQNPQVATAHQIFRQVRAVADKNARRLPKLVVVNSKTNAWAIALPSGHIILSKHALDLCFKNADADLARARLAFVLGHELAHLAHDDYWHQEVEEFLAGNPDAERIAHFLDQSHEAREAELAADDKGYIYAAMAGFPVNRLIQANDKQDFFAYWMQQTQSRVSASHPFPEDRAELLRRRLAMLRQRVGFFDFGVRLAHFGYCEDAVYFLQEFQKVFPGRAVLNNLGVCYLQMARNTMKPGRAWFYWMPFQLDVETRAAALTRGGPITSGQHKFLKNHAGEPEAADQYLQTALDYLQRATQADPAYVPARLNLAMVNLYLGRPHQARAVLSEALQLVPEHPQARLLDALALYEQSGPDVDLWPSAVARLEKGLSKGPAWEYNLARLLTARPRPEEANRHWNRLTAEAATVPDGIRAQICAMQSKIPALACLAKPARAAVQPPWQWPIPSKDAPPLTPTLRKKYFSGWQSIPFDWYKPKLYGFIHRNPNADVEVLEMNQFVHLLAAKGKFPLKPSEIGQYCPKPLQIFPVAQGELYHCHPWAVLVQAGKITQIWQVSR